MASYIQGVTDYIPEIQPFKPDLNFYTKVLQTKQSQYDSALKSINNLYGSLLYSPLTGQDNIKNRDDYFKMIEQDLKKITSMDLSLPQNQTIAQNIFKPLLDDKNLMKDYTFTKKTLNEIDYGNSFLNCKKPEDCPGGHWKQGIDYLYLKLDEFAKATPEKRMSMAAPRYVPFYNLAAEMEQWAKDKDLIITRATTSGGYIIKRKDGKEMEPYLKDTFMAVFGNDPRYQAMSGVKAVMMRKAAIDMNKGKFGGDENKAEEDWFNQVMTTTGKKLEEIAKLNDEMLKRTKNKSGAYEDLITQKGVNKDNIPNDPLLKEYLGTMEDQSVATESNNYYTSLKKLLGSLSDNPENRDMLRAKIDDITAAGLLEEEIDKVTKLYAARNSGITDISADPFALEAVRHRNNMTEKLYEKELDFYTKLLLESAKSEGKAMSFIKQNGAGNLDVPFWTSGGPAQTTGAFGTEGAPNFLLETQSDLARGKQLQQGIPSQGVQVFIQSLDDIISNPNATQRQKNYAMDLKKEVFKSYYNKETNQFTNGSISDSDISKMGFDANKMFNFWQDAKGTVQKAPVFFGETFGKITQLTNQENYGRTLTDVTWSVLVSNSTAIRNFGIENSQAVPNRLKWENFFSNEGNGRYYIKDMRTYTTEAVQRIAQNRKDKGMAPLSTKEMYEAARADYNELYNTYTRLYHSNEPGLRGKLKVTEGFTISRMNASGKTANTANFQMDLAAGPEANGNELFFSMNNLLQKMGSGKDMKVVWGYSDEDKTIGTDRLTGTELAKMANNSQAQLFLQTMLKDYMYGDYKTDKSMKGRPRAALKREQIAGNDYRKRSITVYPDVEYLNKWATKVKGKEEKQLFGMDVSDVAKNGVTLYYNGADDDSKFERLMQQHPYTSLVNSGRPVKVSMPNTGELTIQRVGDKVQLSGTLHQTDAMGKVVNSITFDPSQYSYDIGNTADPNYGGNFESGMLLVGAENLVNQLYRTNYYASQNVPVQNLEYNPQALLQNIMGESWERGMGEMPFQMEQGINKQNYINEQMARYRQMTQGIMGK